METLGTLGTIATGLQISCSCNYMMQVDDKEGCCGGILGNSGWQVPVLTCLLQLLWLQNTKHSMKERFNESAKKLPKQKANTAFHVSIHPDIQLPKEI